MEGNGSARPRGGARRWIWIGAAVVLVAALTGVALYVTGEPWFCGSCHEMKPTVTGWEAGTHKEVSCFACHSEPGVVGYLKAHVVDGLRDVWVHFTRRPDVVRTAGGIVPQERCLACHGDQPQDETPAFPSADKDPNHPPKTAECAECHREAIHGPKP